MSVFYLIFPTKDDNIEDSIKDRKDGENLVKSILMTFDRIDCEKDNVIIIDKENKSNFLCDIYTLESILNYRIGLYNLEQLLLQYISQNSIRLIDVREPQKIKHDYSFKVTDFKAVDNLFKQLNHNRILNRNDFRHCENHPAFNPIKSPLIGGIVMFNRAEELLYSAIGDYKTPKKYLINIDSSNQNFIIRFEDENFNNQYHSFHVAINKKPNYIEDTEKVRMIKHSNKGIPRAYKLITYREGI